MSNHDNRLADYVDVAERIRIFREQYPEGSLQPANPDKPFEIITIGDRTFVVFIAAAYRHPQDERPGIGSAWEPFPGKTPYTANSELMVAETSGWGRAIVAVLAADSKRVASLDEVRNRREQKQTVQDHPANEPSHAPEWPQTSATEQQEKALYAISKKLDRLPPARGSLTKSQAGKLIEELDALVQQQNRNNQ